LTFLKLQIVTKALSEETSNPLVVRKDGLDSEDEAGLNAIGLSVH
jgi:hypothetical protein